MRELHPAWVTGLQTTGLLSSGRQDSSVMVHADPVTCTTLCPMASNDNALNTFCMSVVARVLPRSKSLVPQAFRISHC